MCFEIFIYDLSCTVPNRLLVNIEFIFVANVPKIQIKFFKRENM